MTQLVATHCKQKARRNNPNPGGNHKSGEWDGGHGRDHVDKKKRKERNETKGNKIREAALLQF